MPDFTRWIVRIANWLNWIIGAVCSVVLIALLTLAERILADMEIPLGDRPGTLVLMVAAIALVIPVVFLAHMIFTRVVALIDSARLENSFTEANARRLTTIAWCLLGINIIDLGYAGISLLSSEQNADFLSGWFPTLTGWFAAFLLFILARIFRQGAAMREEIEGMV